MAFVKLKGSVDAQSVVAGLVAAAEHLGNARHALRQLIREQHHHSAESATVVLKQIDAQCQLTGIALQTAFRRVTAEQAPPPSEQRSSR